MPVADYPLIEEHAVRPTKDAPTTKVLAATDDGSYEELRIGDLQRDVSYQRPISQDLVDDIARSWDPKAAGTITVSRRKNGALFIVDGQHRTAAAMQRGVVKMRARVLNGLTAQEEARLRLKSGRRRNDRSLDRFRAQVKAGDPESRHIMQIVEELGGTINLSPRQFTGINGIAAVESIYRKDGGNLLVRTLETIKEAFGSLDGPNVGVVVLKSVAWFLQQHPDHDRGRFMGVLQKYGPNILAQRGRNHKAIQGGALWTNVYRAILEAYNERLADPNKLPLRTGNSSRETGGWTD